MQVVHPQCCGIDVHKRSVVACVLLTAPDGTVRRRVSTFGTMTADLLALADWLGGFGVTHIAMESTGVYWRPVYNLLEEEGRTILLVNPQHMKAVPGRKTDVQDSEWLADLLRHGLLRGSFIPPAPIRALRELTRYRKVLVAQRADEVNRVQKLLEGANVKLASVATDVLGVSGRAMLAALLEGQEDPEALAELARGRLRTKLPELRRALEGRVRAHHRILLAQLLAHIDYLESAIAEMQAEIARALAPYDEAVELLQTIPGVGPVAAAAIVAEIGVDMGRFPSGRHLASWAGVSTARSSPWRTAWWSSSTTCCVTGDPTPTSAPTTSTGSTPRARSSTTSADSSSSATPSRSHRPPPDRSRRGIFGRSPALAGGR